MRFHLAGLTLIGFSFFLNGPTPQHALPAEVWRFIAAILLSSICYIAFIIAPDQSKPSWVWIFFYALGARVIAYRGDPTLDDDLFRYAWDAKVMHHGFNPYQFAPHDANLMFLRDDIWQQMPFKDIPTIYPPLSQLVFFTAGFFNASILSTLKLTALAGEGIVIGLLVRLLKRSRIPTVAIVAYLFHPLAIKEVANAGHNDIWMTAALLACLLTEKHRLTCGFFLACAILIKHTAAILLIALAPVLGIAGLVTAILTTCIGYGLFMPYHPFTGLAQFSAGWEFGDGLYSLFQQILFRLTPQAVDPLFTSHLFAKALLAGLVFIVAVAIARARRSMIFSMMASLFAVVVLSPVINPWYFLWFLPLLCLEPHRILLYTSCSVLLLYHFYADHTFITLLQILIWSPLLLVRKFIRHRLPPCVAP